MKSSKMDFQEYLKISSGEIENELTSYLSRWKKDYEKSTPELKEPMNQFISRIFGGKMLRGTLVKLGYELAVKNPTGSILKPAAAYEIIHTALLTHDDIIDQSPVRRDKPALHVIHRDLQYGLSQAICLGDLGFFLASRLLSESDFSDNKKMKAIDNFLRIITDTILGEMLDIKASHSLNRTEKQILQIQEKKTAQYTIIGPLSLGAILAGATDSFLKLIKEFGSPLGIAYQIHDDILGIFADEKIVGKPVISDIKENKSTLLIVYALKHASKQQLAILKKYYGKKNITSSAHTQIKQVIEETGSLAYSKEKIALLCTQAKAIIPKLTKDKSRQLLLMQMADVIITRKK